MDEGDDTLPAGWADVPIATGRYVVQRGDGTEWQINYDKALWVEMDGERGYLVGTSAHTLRGLFYVCFPDQDYFTGVSVPELTAISAEARYWILGFLAGDEPSIDEYLGRKVSEGYLPTGEEWTRYENFIERYHSQGYHPRLNLRPDRALVITDEERAEIHLDHWRPWTYVGEQVLAADGAEWVEADPQPQMDGPWIAGSVCAERKHDRLMSLQSGWSVCCDCGEVTMDWEVDNH